MRGRWVTSDAGNLGKEDITQSLRILAALLYKKGYLRIGFLLLRDRGPDIRRVLACRRRQ